uniref:(northern house mosquito) hypothetical protein n=1 Tax=Culex pipiens TaxID=7175 RepID=A0A8D8H6B1_CULPI
MKQSIVRLATLSNVAAKFEFALAAVVIQAALAKLPLCRHLRSIFVGQLLEVLAVPQPMVRALARLARPLLFLFSPLCRFLCNAMVKQCGFLFVSASAARSRRCSDVRFVVQVDRRLARILDDL